MRELAPRILVHAPADGANPTAVPGLHVYRRDAVMAATSAVYCRSIILVVQGAKQAQVGDEQFRYDPDHYLVTSVPLPLQSQILEASADRPFLSLAIDLELETVRDLMSRAGDILAPSAAEPPQRGLVASEVTEGIAGIASRLVDLLDHPEDAAVLGPLYRRELHYHVLKGPRGGFLRAVAMGHGQQHAISEVLSTIHADCTRDYAVSELASLAGMSESVFYEAFKSVTAESPLQYIKRLRLQEAHRQLTQGIANVSGAAYGVGYNSLSQFSREFTRVFGSNPSSYLPR